MPGTPPTWPRAAALARVPETITRAAYEQLVTGAGFGLEDLAELRILPGGIEATLYARNTRGDRFMAGDEPAVYVVIVPVVEPEDPR